MGWFSKAKDGFFLSTTTPEGIERSQYLGVVNGEAIIGANIFRDMFSSVRDVVGGRAGGYERALSGARDAALEGLLAKAVVPTRRDRRWQIELAPLFRIGQWQMPEIKPGTSLSLLGFTFEGIFRQARVNWGLNRDTANANQRLDKPDEKAMQERMDLIKSSMELTKGIGDAIAAARIRAADDPNSDVNKATRLKLIDEGIANPTQAQISQRAQQDYGVGSSFQKASQAVTAVVQAAMGGSVGGALAGAAAPYLAQTVKKMTEDDPKANLMAHAVLGAVLARAGGNSALAGAAGAVAAEKTAQLIKESLYGGVSNENLSEAQKQTISSLSTLAAGLSGSLVGKDALNAVAAAQVGKNAVENNLLSPANESLLQKARDAIKRNKYTSEDAKTLIALDQQDQISDALVERLRRNPDSMSAADKAAAQAYLADYANALVVAYGKDEAARRIYALMRPGPLRQSNDVAYAAGNSIKDASLERLYPGDLSAQMNRSPSENEQLYREAQHIWRFEQNYQAEAAVGTPALYALGGSVGLAIRLVTAESGILQITYGGVQASSGDAGDGTKNIFLGLLNASAAGLPGSYSSVKSAKSTPSFLTSTVCAPVTRSSSAPKVIVLRR